LIDCSGILDLSAIAFTLLFAFPNLFLNLDNRENVAWILNFYRFIATKLLVPAIAYLFATVLILSYIYTGLEVLVTLSILLLIVTTFGFLCFSIVAIVYGFVKVMIERSVEQSVLSQKSPNQFSQNK